MYDTICIIRYYLLWHFLQTLQWNPMKLRLQVYHKILFLDAKNTYHYMIY